MWSADYRLFDQLAEACGSRYLAVNYIADNARKLAARTSSWFQESKLITWALTGYEPDVTQILQNVYYATNPDLQEVVDFLCYVSDENIQTSVIDSYKSSIRSGHLVYKYHTELDESEQARVRILLRMIWISVLTPSEKGDKHE